MKEILDSGAIGEVQAIWCRHFVSYGGDAYFRDWHSQRENINGNSARDVPVLEAGLAEYFNSGQHGA